MTYAKLLGTSRLIKYKKMMSLGEKSAHHLADVKEVASGDISSLVGLK